MVHALVVLTLLLTPGHAQPPLPEAWVEAARARFAMVFPDFMSEETATVDEGLVAEVQRLNALITHPVARLNFQNLLTKIWVTRLDDHLALYHLRYGSSPSHAYPYYHAIELTPQIVRGPAGRVVLIEALSHGFDRVTGFGRRHVPGASYTGVLQTRERRAAVEFLRRYVPAEERRRWTDGIIAGGDRGYLDANVKLYVRLRAVETGAMDLVFAEVYKAYQPRIACEMGLWRRYDPVHQRDRLLEAKGSE